MEKVLVSLLLLFLAGSSFAQSFANFQAIHAIADGPDVDIYVEGRKTRSAIPYGSISGYTPFSPGAYLIQVTVAGVSPLTSVLIEQVVEFDAFEYVTLAAIGDLNNMMQYPLQIMKYSDETLIPMEQAILRTLYLSASPMSIDVVANEMPIWKNISFPSTGEPEYLTLNANFPYAVEIKTFLGSSAAIAGPTLVNLPRNTASTLFVIGVMDSESSPLTIVYRTDFTTGDISPSPTRTRSSSSTRTRTPTPSSSFSATATRSIGSTASNTPSISLTRSFSAIVTRSPFRTAPIFDDDDGDFTKSRTPIPVSPFISRTPFRTTVQEPSQSSSPAEVPSNFPSPFVSRSPDRTVVPESIIGQDYSMSTKLVPLSALLIVLLCFL